MLGCVYLDVAVQLRRTDLLVPLGGRVDGGVGGQAVWGLLQPHGLGRGGTGWGGQEGSTVSRAGLHCFLFCFFQLVSQCSDV